MVQGSRQVQTQAQQPGTDSFSTTNFGSKTFRTANHGTGGTYSRRTAGQSSPGGR